MFTWVETAYALGLYRLIFYFNLSVGVFFPTILQSYDIYSLPFPVRFSFFKQSCEVAEL